MEADRLTREPCGERENTPHALYDKWMRNGPQALTPEDWAVVRNAMSTGTDAQGGYTVPTEVSGTIIEALKAFGGMRSVATVISTATGVPMTMPTSDGTAEEGEILGENTAAAAADPSFGVVNLGVHKYSSKTVAVPSELLQDSNADIEAFAGVELVHVPPALLPDAVEQARAQGAALVLAHGESIPRQLVDVVETGTNLAAIRAGVDILAHPGLITPEDAGLATEKGVLLELNTAQIGRASCRERV